MAYQVRDGDIISLDNPKAGALTMSVPLLDWPGDVGDPTELWQQQAAVRIVTGYIARKISAVPFHLYKRVDDTDRQRITGTPVSKMLRMPVTGRGWGRFIEQLVLDMAVHDRWACLVVLDDAGQPMLKRLPAHRVAILTVGGVPEQVVLTTDQGLRLIPLDRVLFDVAPSAMPKPLDRGSSRLVTLSSLLSELDEMGLWRRQIAQNGPRVPAVIERPVDAPAWSDESWNRFRDQFSTYKAGGGNEGGTPILEDGMKLSKAEVFKPSDAAGSTSLRTMTIEEAAMLYGIPPELIGVRPGNYSNIQALRELEYVDVLGSWVSNFEDAFNTGLIAAGLLKDDEYVEANVESRLRGAFEQQAGILSTSVGAPWMTRNEARARQNLPAIEGGDEIITPLNVWVGGQTSPQDGTTEGRGGGKVPLPDDGGDDEDPDPAGGKAIDLPVPLIMQPGWPEIVTEQSAFTRDLSRFWKSQHDRLVQAAGYIEAAGGLKALSGQKADAPGLTPDGWLQWVLANDDLFRLINGRGDRLANAGAEQVLASWNPLSEGFTPEQMAAWVRKASQNNSTLWGDALTERIAELLTSGGWDDFLDDPAIGERLIRRYARTWGTELVEFGRHDAARSSGLTHKTWHTTGRNARATHVALSGITVPIADAFSNGCHYPGDWAGGPAEVANCNCSLSYSRE